MIRVFVDCFDQVIEGDVIGGEVMDEQGGVDLESTFTVRCDDGQCFSIHGWMVDVVVLPNENAHLN